LQLVSHVEKRGALGRAEPLVPVARGADACERVGQPASEELDGIELELVTKLSLALEDRSRSRAEGAVVEVGDLRI
jgi:hypothetical protein